MIRWSNWVTRGDSVVLGVSLIILIMVFSILWRNEGHGAQAVILVNGQQWARLNLFHNQDYHVPGPLGESHIRVQDGKARFINSPCPNKLCVHTGWISQGGENATCLPNQVSLQILGSDARFDTINF